MNAVSMIHTKRYNLRPHTDEELHWWIESFSSGDIPGYQAAAWLMAVCWRGMTPEETASLTKYMVQSGKVVTWDDSSSKRVDKHSTGGVGDKISLVLAPLVAACGVEVPMMAGRGLDHTGGTLDKLESIPGYQTQLPLERFQEIVKSVGCSIVSASQDMCLADRKLYALRDVTGTVSSIPLQTSSILSKKIAEGPDSLVLDIKYGRAAFQSSADEARLLGESMISTANFSGLPTTAFLTRMDHPIGYTVGNWLEVKECVDILKGESGASDLTQLVVVQAAQMLQQAFPERKWEELVDTVHTTLKEGKAYAQFRDMVEAHGGDASVLDDPSSYPEAKSKATIVAPQDGYVEDIDALVVGKTAASVLGAGRTKADEPVDPLAGIVFAKKVGDAVEQDEVVAILHSSKDCMEQATERIASAIRYSSTPVTVPPIITHRVTPSGIEDFVMPASLQ